MSRRFLMNEAALWRVHCLRGLLARFQCRVWGVGLSESECER